MNLFSKTNLSLMNKIIMAFVVYFSMIIIVFSVIVLLIDRGQVKSVATDYATTITADKSTSVSLWLNEKVTNIHTIAMTDVVKSLDDTQYLPFLNEMLENKENIYGRYYVIDQNGIMKDTLGITKDLSDDEDYKKAKAGIGEIVITTATYDDTFRQPTIRIMVPIVVNGRVSGVVGSTILLKELSTLIAKTDIQKTGYAWVVDEAGQVIGHKDDNLVLTLNITTADEVGYDGLSSIAAGMVEPSPSSGMETYKDQSGTKYYVKYDEIENSPGWHVIVTLHSTTVYKTVSQLLLYLSICVAIMILISYGVSYVLAKDITDSIKRLIEVMNKFTSGIKGIRAKIETKDEIGMLSQSFNAMADTIVAHTDNVEELIKERTQTLAELNYQIVSRNKELGTMNEELEKTNDKLHELASTDMLTGLFNRHQFQRELQRTIELVNVGDEQNFSLLFIDLDNFKQYNDTFSHEIGDFLLQEVADILQDNVRDNDIVGRYGGDEFVIMLRQGTYEVAKAIAERMHAAILGRDGFKKELSKKLGAEVKIMGKNKLSSSIGIVNYMKTLNITKAEDLLAMADETMYKAKKAGKSRVVVK